MLGWTGDNGDPDNFLFALLGCAAAKAGSNVAKFWCNKAFEDLIMKAKQSSDQAERDQALRAGAGDLQGAGAVVHDRALGAVLSRCARKWSTSSIDPFGRHMFYGVDIKG